MPRSTKTTRRSEIPVRNRKLTRDRRGPVWPPELESAFDEASADWGIVGKYCPQGKLIGQNRWISAVFYELTGIRRTRRQVASHIQQRRAWFWKRHGALIGLTWDEYIISLYDDDDDEEDDDAVPALIPDSPNEPEYDPPMPATPPPELALPPPALASYTTETVFPAMDAFAANICALGDSWMLDSTLFDVSVTRTPNSMPTDVAFPTAPSPADVRSWIANYSPNLEATNACFPPTAAPATAFDQFPAVDAGVDPGMPYELEQEPWVLVDNPVDLVAYWDGGLAF